MTEKTRRFYAFCNVQTGRRYMQNTYKHLDNKWGSLGRQITYYIYSRQAWNLHQLTQIHIPEKLGTGTARVHWRKWQYQTFWTMMRSPTLQNGVQTTNEDQMGTTFHGGNGERMEIMLAGRKLLDVKLRVYINRLGQSMLEAPQPHTVRRTTRQI